MSAAMLAPPQTNEGPIAAFEAEAALLGSLMLNNSLVDAVADILPADDFHDDFHRFIYQIVLREAAQARTANPVTVRSFLVGTEQEKQSSYEYLCQLTGSTGSVIGYMDFARQIADYAKRRRLAEKLQAVIDGCRNVWDKPTPDLLGEVDAALTEAASIEHGTHEPTGAQCIGEAISAIERQDPGLTSGIGALDDAMGPIRKKNLAILAARPGMGKSAVAGSYAVGAARRGHGVLFISLEMSSEELGERMACDMSYDDVHHGGLLYDSVVTGKVSPAEMRLMISAQDEMAELPLQVIDASSMTTGRLATTVRRWKRRFAARGQSLDLVIVDYLQKLRVPGLTNRFEIITEVSQSLKEIAKTNELGLMALAQLSRKVEERPDKRPILSDLRESGQIEQDADIILFLLREEYYLLKTRPHDFDPKFDEWEAEYKRAAGLIDFICAKRRKGAERTTHGRFWGQYQAVRG